MMKYYLFVCVCVFVGGVHEYLHISIERDTQFDVLNGLSFPQCIVFLQNQHIDFI